MFLCNILIQALSMTQVYFYFFSKMFKALSFFLIHKLSRTCLNPFHVVLIIFGHLNQIILSICRLYVNYCHKMLQNCIDSFFSDNYEISTRWTRAAVWLISFQHPRSLCNWILNHFFFSLPFWLICFSEDKEAWFFCGTSITVVPWPSTANRPVLSDPFGHLLP